MRALPELDRRPVLVALAGPNGAGKTTFFHAHLRNTGLELLSADLLVHELGLEPYAAAQMAGDLRARFVEARESFAFETVFSDPVGDKVSFLAHAGTVGYTVVLCFIGLDGPERSEERVCMRVSQGGHDVPADKLRSRYPRTMRNLAAALRLLPIVYVFDNCDLSRPFRTVAAFRNGLAVERSDEVPAWFQALGV